MELVFNERTDMESGQPVSNQKGKPMSLYDQLEEYDRRANLDDEDYQVSLNEDYEDIADQVLNEYRGDDWDDEEDILPLPELDYVAIANERAAVHNCGCTCGQRQPTYTANVGELDDDGEPLLEAPELIY